MRPPERSKTNEAAMNRTPKFLAALSLVLAFFFSLPGHGQDSPSLGDLARQAQKDKEKDKASKPAAKVFTNEDMPSRSGAGGGAAMLGAGAPPASQGASSANISPAEKLAQLEKIVDVVESLDKATLVRTALQDKSEVNFPGRAAWEQRLSSARDTYVVQARAVLQKAKEIVSSADTIKGIKDPNDPRVKEVNARLQNLMRDAVQTDAGMQSVIMEGRDLASQAGTH
jgi:hypothetical protein